ARHTGGGAARCVARLSHPLALAAQRGPGALAHRPRAQALARDPRVRGVRAQLGAGHRAVSRPRAGVVGVGHLGHHHARAWSRLEGATLAGAYDPDTAARARASRELSLPMFDTLEALVDRVELA